MTLSSDRPLSCVNARLVYWLMALAILPLGLAQPPAAEASGSDTWARLTPTPREGLGVGVVNGVLYAVGGYDYYGAGYLATVEAYDRGTNIWTTKAAMPTAREGLGVGVVDGVLYAVGGYNGSSYLATVEAYDPATNTWSTKAAMPTARGWESLPRRDE